MTIPTLEHAPSALPPGVDLARTITPPIRGLAKLRAHLGAAFYNGIVTGLPSHTLRQSFLRAAGATIGRRVAILGGTLVVVPSGIHVGDRSTIGFRCFLGGEGGLHIAEDVNISSFCVLLGGYHEIDSPTFASIQRPIVIEDHAWLATGVTVMSGIRIGRGAVGAAGAVITRDVPPYTVVGGVPAKRIGERDPAACVYELGYRPRFF